MIYSSGKRGGKERRKREKGRRSGGGSLTQTRNRSCSLGFSQSVPFTLIIIPLDVWFKILCDDDDDGDASLTVHMLGVVKREKEERRG